MTWALPPGMVDAPAVETPDVSSAAEAKASLLLRLRARGIRDIGVLRAMEAVPRANFVLERHAGLVPRDIALPIGCGQTMSEPSFVGLVLEALRCREDARVLEVGSGSGYATALLARLSGEVIGTERFQTLAMQAESRLLSLDVANAAILWADGLAPDQDLGLFDRIVVHAALDAAPTGLLQRLAPAGILVYAEKSGSGGGSAQTLMRVTRAIEAGLIEEVIGPSRLQSALSGRSALL